MTEHQTPATPAPSEQLARLDRIVGQWHVTGGAEGEVTYRWMEGGFFLLQQVDLEHEGMQITGMEVIGNLRPFGEQTRPDVTSRFYDSQGNTLDYTYELDADTLTIWGGEKGSPAYFRGVFNADDSVLAGAWVYPGGGYDSTMTRIRPEPSEGSL